MSAPAYAELHCLSAFSFQRGASTADELFERASELGYRALAITDECSLAGIVRAFEASKRHGVPLIVGTEFRIEDGPHVVLLCRDHDGYTALCQLITVSRRRAKKGSYRTLRSDFSEPMPGLVCIWIPKNSDSEGTADWLRTCFGLQVWIGLHLHAEGARHL